MSVAGKQQSRGVDVALLQGLHLFQQHLRIHHYARTDDRRAMGIQDPGRNEVQRVSFATDDDRVAGVVPALIPDYEVGVLGEQVGDFAFALVAPLDPNQGGTGHGYLSIRNWMRT